MKKMRLLNVSHLTKGKVDTYSMKSQRLQLQGFQKGAALKRDLYFLILASFWGFLVGLFREKEG